ncbi:MAG: hypothetical protein JNL87_05940 [Burkholderiaceae bacterium]|nr:hypothetical protein [Burkholderiaceae bacterium]
MPAQPCRPRRRDVLAQALLLPLAGRTQTRPGSTWRVGAGEAVTRVAEALRLAADGDTIELLSGTYRGDVAVIRQRRLTIVGVGERPLLAADGQHADGKAIWVVRDGDVRIENIAFQGARVPDGNGAGIRFEGGRLSLHRCRFSDNQMGLLTGNRADSELLVTDCEFADAPPNAGGLPHLLYVGRIGRFSIRDSVLRHGNVGHLLKSRARESIIAGNRLDDGRDGQASYEIDLPNGGIADVSGNTLVQGPLTQNPVMLSYGAEGQPWDENRLLVRDNSFINHRGAGGSFIRVWADRLPPGTPVLTRGNRFLGRGELELGPNGRSQGDQRGPAPAD